jgi:DNA-binding transcriptional ArsR family regulator
VDPYAALADPVRRALLRQLAHSPARVVDLAAGHPISRPAISRHLRVLGEAGLVAGEDHGRERHYRLEIAGLAPVAAFVAELAPPAPPIPEHALDGLDLEVRRTAGERVRSRPTEESA